MIDNVLAYLIHFRILLLLVLRQCTQDKKVSMLKCTSNVLAVMEGDLERSTERGDKRLGNSGEAQRSAASRERSIQLDT